MLIFTGKNLYRFLKSGMVDGMPAKDSVYRFSNSTRYNWRKFLLTLSSLIIRETVSILTGKGSLLSFQNKKNRFNEVNSSINKRTNGYKLRKESMKKTTDVMLELLDQLAPYGVSANYRAHHKKELLENIQ
jgi:hypothetical protein